MEQHIVSILSIQDVTHDVRAYRLEKPPGYRFVPGQATDVAINKEGWREERHHKTPGDIIYHEELDTILGQNVHYVLTKESNPSYLKGPIDKTFLQREIKDFSRPFYVCGPDQMVKDLTGILGELGAKPDSVVFEK